MYGYQIIYTEPKSVENCGRRSDFSEMLMDRWTDASP